MHIAGHSHARQLNSTYSARPVTLTPQEQKQYKDLVDAAVAARTHAYAPNSHSLVGSAVLARNGKIYTGANFENTAYADHGEQVALARALAAGEAPQDLTACAVFVAKEGGPTPEDFHKQGNMTSCGNCRQAIFEINPDMREILLGADGEHVEAYLASDMLPKAYHRERTPQPNTAPQTSSNSDPLIAQALIARSRSFVPRSNQPVGAAVETTEGNIYTGIRVETSSFSTQAERMALAEAMMHGQHNIKRLVIVGGSNENGEIPQRLSWDSFQAIAQQSPQAQVVLPDGRGDFTTLPIGEVPGFLMKISQSKSE